MNGFSKVVLGSLVVFFSLSTVAVAAGDSTSLQNTRPAQQYAPADGMIVTSPRGLQTFYPDQTSASADPLNTNPAYLDSLPSCPGDPSNSAAASKPICPDVNNKWTQNLTDGKNIMITGGSAYDNKMNPLPALAKYCPDLCTSTRFIHYMTSSSNTGVTYNRVDQFKPAICPPGYSQVAALKSDFDVVYNNSTVFLLPTDDTQRIAYEKQGADCDKYSTQKNTARPYCSYSSNTTVKSQTNECNFNNNGYGFKYLPNGTMMYGKWTNCEGAIGAHDRYGCFQAGDSTCTKYLVLPGVQSNLRCDAQPGYSTKFMGNVFVKVICALPPGYYLSANTVPTKVVCSRVKTIWQMQQ